MSQELENYLEQAIDRLEGLRRKIAETQGYGRETELCGLLKDLAKEQMPDEDTNHSTHSTR